MNITNILLSDCCGALPIGSLSYREVCDENDYCHGEEAFGVCCRCEDESVFSDETHRYFMRDFPEVTIKKADDGDEDRHQWIYEVLSYNSVVARFSTLERAANWCREHQLKAVHQLY